MSPVQHAGREVWQHWGQTVKSNRLAKRNDNGKKTALRWGQRDSVKQVHLKKKKKKRWKTEVTGYKKMKQKMIQNTNKHVENSCRYWNNEKEARAGISDLRKASRLRSLHLDRSHVLYMGATWLTPSKKQNKTNTTAVPLKEAPCVRHVKRSELR